jgi:hypothetical protein
METCYKVMRTESRARLGLTAERFDIEPEITARLLREAPDRRAAGALRPAVAGAGKKIGWRDGVTAIRTLVRHRVTSPPRR